MRIFIITSTSSNVAVLRMFPEIVISDSEMSGCWSASVSRHSLTSWSLRASRRIAVEGIAYPLSRSLSRATLSDEMTQFSGPEGVRRDACSRMTLVLGMNVVKLWMCLESRSACSAKAAPLRKGKQFLRRFANLAWFRQLRHRLHRYL
jgi:hypothetical protein